MGKILIVDDDIELAELTSAFFKQKGHLVTRSEDAEVSIQSLMRRKLQPDLILVDLKMPRISGVDFIRRLRSEGNSTPIIVITGHRNVDTAMEAIAAGAFDYVVKPLNYSQLLISAERALRFSRLENENHTLKSVLQIKEGTPLPEIKGKSPQFLKVLDLAKRVANTKSNIYISGESGTGKEVLARAIHRMSSRREAPFIAINCSAIPENLLESELFGYAKGAFTGAAEKKIGLFEEASGGTLFLDEIGDLTISLQAKLLRVVQERKVKRIGENQERSVDFRLISATHKDLRKEVQEHRFREDLFFRLNVIPLTLPPLRERREDIVPLAEFFLKKYSTLNDLTVTACSRDAIAWLLKQRWTGNVRELENTIERAVILCRGNVIELSDLTEFEPLGFAESVNTKSLTSFPLPQALDEIWTLETVVKKYITEVLKKNGGAKDRTAKALNMDRKTLYRKLKEIEREPQFHS